ncbi:amidohydrolase family protein [Actinophytocola gossypii]|uniref:Amidohydrolase family protein n=1 Tax=Actinophytocola gossypii TaxID=2812003 RepID=A0ABT2J1R6_9PSEU|nr:amidohydrolase family protein [Actinophytocola gossypii]MCT2581796.1 amidohydrolase family protein [Actinophytocola gossypii]
MTGAPQQVFDFHVRLLPSEGALERLLNALDRNGIDRAVACAAGMIRPDVLSRQLIEGGHVRTSANNDAVLAGCAASNGRLVPFYFANPHDPVELYQARAAEFRGLEISPAVHGVELTDQRVHQLVEVAAAHRHPVYAVGVQRAGCGVAEFAKLARQFPDLPFVLGHLGIGQIDFHGVNLIRDVDNALVETSGGYSSVAMAAVERLGAHRVLFGSEYPMQDPSLELLKIQVLGLDQPQLELVMSGNARRLLGEEQP